VFSIIEAFFKVRQIGSDYLNDFKCEGARTKGVPIRLKGRIPVVSAFKLPAMSGPANAKANCTAYVYLAVDRVFDTVHTSLLHVGVSA